MRENGRERKRRKYVSSRCASHNVKIHRQRAAKSSDPTVSAEFDGSVPSRTSSMVQPMIPKGFRIEIFPVGQTLLIGRKMRDSDHGRLFFVTVVAAIKIEISPLIHNVHAVPFQKVLYETNRYPRIRRLHWFQRKRPFRSRKVDPRPIFCVVQTDNNRGGAEFS